MASTSINPYIGPRSFNQGEGTRFFGRAREARELLARVISERLLLFYAQSGVGKTSLINARLIPDLQSENFTVLPVGRVSGELPEDVSNIENVYVYNLILSLDRSHSSSQQFDPTTLSEFLGSQYAALSDTKYELDDDPPMVLIIDQFEEIITTHTAYWRHRESFFHQLRTAMTKNPMLWVMLTLREEYVAAVETYAYIFPDKMRATFYMQRMTAKAALEAIQKPARLGGRPFVPVAAKNLVNDLRQIKVQGQAKTEFGEYIEPVQLQVVCYQLWKKLQDSPGSEITVQDLQDSGNVNDALAEFYEQAIQKTLQEYPISERVLRNWFDKKLITEDKTRSMVYQGKLDMAGLDNKAAKLLASQFLLRSERRARGIWYELIHDRFINPILQANQAWWKQQSPLLRAAQAWEDSGREKRKLYRGWQLEEAQASVRGTPEPLIAEFLAASDAENRVINKRLESVEVKINQRIERFEVFKENEVQVQSLMEQLQQWKEAHYLLQEIFEEIISILNLHQDVQRKVGKGEEPGIYDVALQGIWESCQKKLNLSDVIVRELRTLQHSEALTEHDVVKDGKGAREVLVDYQVVKISQGISEILLQPLSVESLKALEGLLRELKNLTLSTLRIASLQTRELVGRVEDLWPDFKKNTDEIQKDSYSIDLLDLWLNLQSSSATQNYSG